MVVLQIRALVLLKMAQSEGSLRTSTSYTLDKKRNKATIHFEIHDFKDERRRETEVMMSEAVSIGRSAFYLLVCPAGGTKKDMMSVFLLNKCDHGVVVDFSIKAMGGAADSVRACRIEKRASIGRKNFMRGNKVDGSLKFVAEVTVKSEETGGETAFGGMDLAVEQPKTEKLLDQLQYFNASMPANMSSTSYILDENLVMFPHFGRT